MEDLKVITIPLTTRGRDRGGRYYWETRDQGKKGNWGFCSTKDFRYCTWPKSNPEEELCSGDS